MSTPAETKKEPRADKPNRGKGGGRDRGGRDKRDRDDSGLIESVVKIYRVAKVVKGGRRFSFSAIVVVGDGNGSVGAAMGKALEVPEAIRKAIEKAKRNMVKVPVVSTTIPHEAIGRKDAARVLLKPASLGTGVIAGGAVRAVVEAAGYKNILTKSLGSNNSTNVVWATIDGLRQLKTAEEVARIRGKEVADIL